MNRNRGRQIRAKPVSESGAVLPVVNQSAFEIGMRRVDVDRSIQKPRSAQLTVECRKIFAKPDVEA
jgi:hypothetical protein